jgi:hypothetical protein
VAKGQSIEPSSNGRTGLSVFDGVLIVGGGIIVVAVAVSLLGFLATVVWTVVKFIILVAVIGLVVKLVFRRRS